MSDHVEKMGNTDNLVEKIWTGVRFALLILGIVGVSSSAFQIWLLTEVVGNGKRLEQVNSEAIGLVKDAESALSNKISEVSEKLSILNAALGSNPERIQRAALEVERAASQMVRLENGVNRISTLQSDLDSLKSESSAIRTDIAYIKAILDGKPSESQR